MNSIILIAPPAGGKGTQSELICSKYNIPHISTGDLLREASKEDEKLKEQMKSGLLISDDIIIALIKDRISKSDCVTGYVLDGFPRNIDQAKEYDKMLESVGSKIGFVFLLDLPKEIASKRIAGRLSCSRCGRVYNSYFDEMKPKEDNMCDDCHIPLIKREDDNEETYEVRYNTYLTSTQPLINYYQDKGILHTIDSTVGVEEAFDQIDKIVRGV